MPQFRKKPIVIDAYKLTKANVDDLSLWCGGRAIVEIDALNDELEYVGINIPTLEGVMRASEGDYIIKGVKGEFYPCKPDIFNATYEPI